MLVDHNDWGEIVSKMGIKNKDEIIIYDNSDVLAHVVVGLILFILVMIQN